MGLPYAILIAGPTASGKTSLAVALVHELVRRGALTSAEDAVIINADSMQIYEGLHILSARPDEAEMADVPHRLFGFLSPDRAFSVADWVSAAMQAIEAAHQAGQLPILVGGTGLYIKALLTGLAEVPEIPEAVRDAVRREAKEKGPEALHAELGEHDPRMASRLEPGDTQRICRALEVLRATGRSLADWQENTHPGPLHARDEAGKIAKFILTRPRDEVYARIEKRFDEMVAEGALEEARALGTKGLAPDLPAMKALGLPSLLAHVQGDMTLAEALTDAKTQTRRYAKRQMTWMGNQFGDWPRVDVGQGISRSDAVEALIAALPGVDEA